ncbi:UNVERIFIED_CONTAM: hypothetical protein FKN15_013922 [Acipenser sinensis]
MARASLTSWVVTQRALYVQAVDTQAPPAWAVDTQAPPAWAVDTQAPPTWAVDALAPPTWAVDTLAPPTQSCGFSRITRSTLSGLSPGGAVVPVLTPRVTGWLQGGTQTRARNTQTDGGDV